MVQNMIPMHDINPPLLNSACPWATTLAQLQELYDSEHTGAVTTRTCTYRGYPDDPAFHQVAFFGSDSTPQTDPDHAHSSINSYGYSPLSLDQYLGYIKSNFTENDAKPIILSFAGSIPEVQRAWQGISETQRTCRQRLAMEVNLSCPNIFGKPPPALDSSALRLLLSGLRTLHQQETRELVPLGFKLPPYTSSSQIDMLRDELILSATEGFTPSFLTATNTLGNCLLMSAPAASAHSALASEDGRGLGGVGGTTLHPLALGNVRSLRLMLDSVNSLKEVILIGVGGVCDSPSASRMRSAGANAVAVATGLGIAGVSVFETISNR